MQDQQHKLEDVGLCNVLHTLLVPRHRGDGLGGRGNSETPHVRNHYRLLSYRCKEMLVQSLPHLKVLSFFPDSSLFIFIQPLVAHPVV